MIGKKLVSMVKKTRCTCEQCRVIVLEYVSRAPLEDGGYTSFYLHRCKECGGIRGFPDENLDIAIARGTEATKQELRRVGVPNV